MDLQFKNQIICTQFKSFFSIQPYYYYHCDIDIFKFYFSKFLKFLKLNTDLEYFDYP